MGRWTIGVLLLGVAVLAGGCASSAKAPLDVPGFYEAVEKGRLAEVRAGLAAHPEWLNVTANHWEATPLAMAAYGGKKEVAEFLIARGADVNASTNKGHWRPLHEAAVAGHAEIAALLIDHGADLSVVNKDGATPLFVAADSGKRDVVLLLLARGAKVDAANKDGWTLLHAAAGGGDVELAKVLLAKGAAVDKKTGQGRTPLHWAASAEVARLLVEQGAEVNAVDLAGRRPLHLAAFFGLTEVARALLDKGAEIDAADRAGLTALDLAADEVQKQTAALLISRGAKVNQADGAGRTVATRAVKPGAGTETWVGPRGQFYLNGRAMIPFGVWQQPPYLMSYHRALGVNCMVYPPSGGSTGDSSTPQYVAAAEALGLGAIVHFKPELATMKGTWGWIGVGWPMAEARQGYELARREGGRRIVQCNFGGHDIIKGQETEFYRQSFRYIDSIVPHVWPEMFEKEPRNLRNVALMVDAIRKLCQDRPGGEVSIWPDINPHRWHLDKARGSREFPEPTIAEFKFQIWLGLIHGADGFCIFPISFEPFVSSQIPCRMEEAMPGLIAEVQKFAEVLAAEESPLKVTVRGDGGGATKDSGAAQDGMADKDAKDSVAAKDAKGGIVDKSGIVDKGGIIDFTTRRFGGKDYVFLVNGVAAAQTVRLEVEGLGTTLALRDALKGAPLASPAGVYEEKLEGLELRIWELVPTK